jgi:hypothetical protein
MTLHRTTETVVTEPGWVRVLLWLGLPALGAGAGWLLAAATGWIASLEWAPMRGLFELVDSLPDPLVGIGGPLLGAGAGLVLVLAWEAERLTVTASDDVVTLTRDRTVRRIARAELGAVFRDGQQLVLLDRDGAELAREQSDLDIRPLAEAFRAHGYPWRDDDPYRDAFRRWLPEQPELPAGANAILKARQRALEQKDRADAAELRRELARLGVVVREERTRQYWRPATGFPPS